MSIKQNQNASVLKKDTELKFPHALLISASAGSGKTYTLTRRYIQLLLSSKIPFNKIENILAVTFTNNAAKEMKSRILGWLKEIALDKNCGKMEETLKLISLSRDAIHEKAKKAVELVIDNYSDFHIQTIDSFLTRIMSCSVAELGLPLNPEITMTYDALIDLALYSMFSKIGKKELPREEIDKFLAILPKSGSYPWNPASRVKDNFNNFLNAEGKTSGKIVHDKTDYDIVLKERFGEVLKFCEGLKAKLPNDSLIKDSSSAAIKEKNLLSFLANYNFKFGILNSQKKKYFHKDWEKDIEFLNSFVIELAEINAAVYYHPYISIYARFKEELEKIKNGKSEVIHINDIAKNLSAYIDKNSVPEIYLKLGERISHFLVDEFQDTNSLQWDNIRPLVEEALAKRGSLFAVGDIKQAIYMFRNADYKIMRDFLDVAEEKKDETKYLNLDSVSDGLELKNLPINYRSDGRILNYADNLFKEKLKNTPELIADDITELTVYEQAVKKGRESLGYVQTEVFETFNINEDAIEKEKLLEIIESASRRYPLNEIAILVAKNKRIEPIVQWLTEKNIPVASLSSLDIRNRKVIAELLALLKFLETPSDDLAFSAFVCGDIFLKLAEKDLKKEDIADIIFEIKQRGRKELLYPNFQAHSKFKKYWDEYFAELFKKVGYLPLYELVSLVYSKFKIFENFKEESAFLAKFLDAVIKLEGSGAGNLRTFLEFAQVSDDDKEAVFSIDLPNYVDAARVMSFHKSKGLGFSVIINLIYDERADTKAMYFKEAGGIINVFRITKDMAEVSPKLKPIYKAKKLDEDVQDLNLLYVISTRAKHELYNIVVKKITKAKSKDIKLIDIFEDYESKSSLPLKSKEVKAFKLKSVDIIAPSPKQDTYDFENLRPTYKSYFETSEGALCHDILSKVIFLAPNTPKELKEHYDTFVSKYNFDFNKTKIIKSLSDFLAIGGIKEYFTEKPERQIKTEAEFIDKNGALRRMDRLIIDKDKVTLIDFKTGAENTENYNKQMLDYIAILSEVYKDSNIKAVIAYIDLKKIEVIGE
ncbi:MAG: UvrD-helicase domain-containing protein [Elusimicrobia bacterium]|nr:UvrD-helicase domain-containing protein [Elusimicrobiota bacterium]